MWKDLTLQQKAEIMKMSVANGVTDINDIQQLYDDSIYAEDSHLYKNAGPLDKTKQQPKYQYGIIEQILRENGVNFRVTSGARKPNQAGNAGKSSAHTYTIFGNSPGAIDIVPGVGSDWNTLFAQMNSPKVRRALAMYGLDVLNETNPSVMASTHATGPHLHVGRGIKGQSGTGQMFGGTSFGGGKGSIMPQYSGDNSYASMMQQQAMEPIMLAGSNATSPWLNYISKIGQQRPITFNTPVGTSNSFINSGQIDVEPVNFSNIGAADELMSFNPYARKQAIEYNLGLDNNAIWNSPYLLFNEHSAANGGHLFYPGGRLYDIEARSDNTARIAYNPRMRVMRQDTPARREKETREYQANIERGQRIMNTFARTPAGRRAANRAYAIESQKAKQEAAKEEAAAVVGNLFKPLMPSTYVDMAAAIKNGQVNNVTDALAAPYLSDSWSMRNPGKALVADIAAPLVLGGASKIVKGAGIPLGNGTKWHLRLPINDNYYYRQGNNLIADAENTGVIAVKSRPSKDFVSSKGHVFNFGKTFDVPFFSKGSPWYGTNNKLETIVNTGTGGYDWMPITKGGRFRPTADRTNKFVMSRVTPLVDGEAGLARASDFIGFTPKRLGYISRKLNGGIPTPDNVKYSFGIPSFDELSNLYTRVANEYRAKQLTAINKAHDDVVEYLGSNKNIERLINAGATKEQAERIAFDMQQNAMATKGIIGLPNSSTALGEYNPDFKVNFKMNVPIWSNESRLRPTFEPEYIVREGIPLEDTYSTVVHELGGHGATLAYNPMYGIEDPKVQKLYRETIKQWSPSTEQVYNHNGLLQPSRKPEYMTLAETDPVEKRIRYLEDVDEYSARARASHILPSTTDMLDLYKYFTKETVDRLKNNVWTISPFLVGSGLAAKNK